MHDETDEPPVIEASQRKLTNNERILVALFLGVAAILGVSHSLSAVSKKSEVDAIREEMQVLADAGQPEAFLWVSKNVDARDVHYAEKLKAAAETGHPESVYRYALFLGFRSQPLERDAWMRKAAEVGYPQAVTIMHNKRTSPGSQQ